MFKGSLFKGLSPAVKITLIISLALNLVVFGSLLGHRLWHWQGGHHAHGMKQHILKIIPEPKRAAVDKILSDYENKHPKGKRFQDWSKFEEILIAKTFERSQFLKTIQSEIDRRSQRFQAGGKAIADIADLLSTEERISVMKKLKKKWHRRKKYHHRHHH